MGNLQSMYRSINQDNFPKSMELSFITDSGKQTMVFEKVTWNIAGEEKGLRYGENPDQAAAFYKLINGNLTLGDVETIQAGNYLLSDMELLQSGKHPGKTNITDIDNALNILRYLTDKPGAVIVKHNNPCGVAQSESLAQAYHSAYFADRVAAFGGAIALNRSLDKDTAEQIVDSYSEVVAAPEFNEGVMDLLSKKKNLRIMRISNIKNLHEFNAHRFLDFKSLIDGGLILQWNFLSAIHSKDDLLTAETEYKGTSYKVEREPTEAEIEDMIFGWKVEAGVTSNSVLFVKNGATVGIGTGEQDRVGVAEIAKDKAYTKLADRIAWEKYKTPFNLLADSDKINEILNETKKLNGGLKDSVMVSDAFFPFRDGIDVGLKEGVSAVIQPGGSLRDFESIIACNEYKAAMKFTGQRSFKH